MVCKKAGCGCEVDVKTGRGRKPKYCLVCRTSRTEKKVKKVAVASNAMANLDLS